MSVEKKIDVLGIGNAIIDVIADADDAFLANHNLNKGSMTLVDETISKNSFACLPVYQHCSSQSCHLSPSSLHFFIPPSLSRAGIEVLSS